ncbi:DUF1311 domain-containing protein (plasmid) [Edwardsiella tarda]|uniref:lysozyme inhibitor LprI family protein n=1 Tax=Edwardsiella tarda TaxID=636 RepID=UPI000D51B693|nr:lysozyme inhibitor LprI family protein [Edwardsiella tarda]UCQ29541.1 DUF1311 domain-containing protein [Edwardsiella tarda]
MRKYLLIVFSVFSFAATAGSDAKIALAEYLDVTFELGRYLQWTYKHHSHDPELVNAIKIAQKDWEAYMSSHCDSVYTQWRDGSVRSVMAISCKNKLTKQRTHEVWETYLTYIDSTPPVLPEPK